MLGTDFSWLSPPDCQQNQPGATDRLRLQLRDKFTTDTVRTPARAPFSSYTHRALQDQGAGTLILTVLSMLSLIVAICGRAKLIEFLERC